MFQGEEATGAKAGMAFMAESQPRGPGDPRVGARSQLS